MNALLHYLTHGGRDVAPFLTPRQTALWLSPTSLLIVSLQFEQGAPCMWMDLAFSTGGGGVTPENFSHLLNLARLAGATTIAFQTRHKGVVRMSRRYGFTEKCRLADGNTIMTLTLEETPDGRKT